MTSNVQLVDYLMSVVEVVKYIPKEDLDKLTADIEADWHRLLAKIFLWMSNISDKLVEEHPEIREHFRKAKRKREGSLYNPPDYESDYIS